MILRPSSYLSLLQREAHSQYRSEVAAVPSLSPFSQHQPHLLRARHVHAGRNSPLLVREWTLARCGHHPFPEGRSARHSAAGVLQHPCLCGCPQWTLLHGLRVCPVFHSQRQTWLHRMRYCQVDTAGLSDDDFLSLIFMPHHANNSQPVVAAHILFVAHVCRLQRWFLEGCDASRG